MAKRRREWAWCGNNGGSVVRSMPMTKKEAIDSERFLDDCIADWTLCYREVGPWREERKRGK